MDEFSETVAKKFRCQFPQWIQYYENFADEGAEVFTAKIPSPGGQSDTALVLDTSSGEVTVCFDSYHAHFDDYHNNDAYADALVFVQKIISNEYVVVSYWRDSEWCGSDLLPITDVPIGNEEYPYANLIKVCSWVGDYDQKMNCIPRG